MNRVHARPPGQSPLASLDLNLLVTLDVLLRVRSVTRAGELLGLSQPAMSHALARLRSQLGDALLVRGTRGMVPTPRAEALARPLHLALAGLADALAGHRPFEPGTTVRTFHLASPDLFDTLVLPGLMRALAAEAPGARLVVAPGMELLAERLERGELDVAVIPAHPPPDGPMGARVQGELRTRRLLVDRFAAFVRAGHPALGRPRAGLPALARLGHVMVSPSGQGEGLIDRLLAERGLTRQVVLRVPSLAAAVAVVRHGELVLIAPSALSAHANALGLARLPLSFSWPRHSVNAVWHPRFDDDPGHRWFREQLARAAAALPAQGSTDS